MRRVLFIISCCLGMLHAGAQEFSTHWIGHPQPDESSEIVFRHCYVTPDKPRQASITLATTGKVKVYVNGRNVMRDIFLSNRDSNTVTLFTYDVTRFLRPDSNTIAVRYAPGHQRLSGKQLSLEYYGKDWQGKAFFHQAGKDWKCRKANESSHTAWKSPINAYEMGYKTNAVVIQHACDSINVLTNILRPVSMQEDSTGVHYDFGRYFTGYVRLTLRSTTRGETISMGNYTYICKGQVDEQCSADFSCEEMRAISVTGDAHFHKSQIQKVEGLEFCRRPRKSYLY